MATFPVGIGFSESRLPLRSKMLGVGAATFFFAAAAAMQVASLQRWVWAGEFPPPSGLMIEDHLFDFVFPGDPWQPLGMAAQLSGVAYLCLAVGAVLLTAACALGRRMSAGAWLIALLVAPLIASSLALPFALIGVHALRSGMAGQPTELADLVTNPLVGVILVAGIIGLAVMAASKSIAWLAAAVFLLGVTPQGYFVAAFLIAPVLAGGISYDTTRWTETVLAAATLLAATAVTIGVAEKRRRIFTAATAGGAPTRRSASAADNSPAATPIEHSA